MGVFELNRICLETLRYPSRKVRVTELGLYSTFENAYEKLQELVVESKKKKVKRKVIRIILMHSLLDIASMKNNWTSYMEIPFLSALTHATGH